MPSHRVHQLLIVGSALTMLVATAANAQIVRRSIGGGVQVNAPFVRVNVGPGGTSVRAPYAAVDTGGRGFFGRRRRMMAQQQQQVAAQAQRNAARQQRTASATDEAAKQPTPANVDALPYPTVAQLQEMDDATAVETLREMMGRLNYRLSLLETAEGWQKYLILSREILGAPGAGPEAAQLDSVRTMVARYESVMNNPEFTKIATFPSFLGAYNALAEVDRRFPSPTAGSVIADGPAIADPSETAPAGPSITPADGGGAAPAQRTEDAVNEVLPTPTPAALPNATRGERSILKRK